MRIAFDSQSFDKKGGIMNLFARAVGVSAWLSSQVASADPLFDRSSWRTWNAVWQGDYWSAGNFGTDRYMTCVAVDGSVGSPEYWAAGFGDHAARDAYMQCLDWVNVADRNPAYIEVTCGY